MRDVPCQVCQVYINNRYFIYIITYLYNPSTLLPQGFSAFSPSGRGRPGPVARPFSAENQEWRNSNVFGWHRAGTAVARLCLGPSGGFSGEPHAGGTPIPGPRRSRTALDGPAAFRGGGGSKGPHGGPVTRGRAPVAPRGLLRSPSTVHGPRSAFSDLRPVGPAGGLDGGFRLYPIIKLGRRCRKLWGGCLPSFSDTVHPGAYTGKPRR